MKPVAENRRGTFDIAIEETLEAGLVLTGDEIKSIRADRVQLTGAYVRLMRGKKLLARPVVVGMHLSLAKEPERTRELLLSAKEIRQLHEQVGQVGMAVVPLNVHFKHGWAKLTIGVGKGRKKYDKRELLKKRDTEREQRRALGSK
jgi:SsrA-binding protein